MDKTVKLITCNTSVEAHILQGKLRSAGIDSVLHNENMSNLYGGMIAAFTGVDIFVFEDEFERAREIINQQEEVDSDGTEEGE